MRAVALVALSVVVGAVLPAVSHAETYEEKLARNDQARARERCLKNGLKPDTPELQTCINDTAAWMAQNRRQQQRMMTD